MEPMFAGRFSRRLEMACREREASAIHSIPTDLDFVQGWRVAQRLGCKFFISVHDDLLETVGRHPFGHLALKQFPEIWRGADARFVISEQLGREYCLRFGERGYEVVTDGLVDIASPRARKPGRLNIYFMGMFHLSYEANLSALLQGVEAASAKYPDCEITVTMRGAVFRRGFGAAAKVRILPFGTEADVQADLQEADLVYLPLPFRSSSANFVRYSLSTKMVTYLGCGLPILYHGPREAAACEVLSENGAALICDSLEPSRVSLCLGDIIGKPEMAAHLVAGAATLARKQFVLSDQRARFWGSIASNMGGNHSPQSSRAACPE